MQNTKLVDASNGIKLLSILLSVINKVFPLIGESCCIPAGFIRVCKEDRVSTRNNEDELYALILLSY